MVKLQTIQQLNILVIFYSNQKSIVIGTYICIARVSLIFIAVSYLASSVVFIIIFINLRQLSNLIIRSTIDRIATCHS